MRSLLVVALATVSIVASAGFGFSRDFVFDTLGADDLGYSQKTFLIRVVDPDTKCEYIALTESTDKPQFAFNPTGLTPRLGRDGKQICGPETGQ